MTKAERVAILTKNKFLKLKEKAYLLLILDYSHKQGTCTAKRDVLLRAFPGKVLSINPKCRRPEIGIRPWQRIGSELERLGLIMRCPHGQGNASERWVVDNLEEALEKAMLIGRPRRPLSATCAKWNAEQKARQAARITPPQPAKSSRGNDVAYKDIRKEEEGGESEPLFLTSPILSTKPKNWQTAKEEIRAGLEILRGFSIKEESLPQKKSPPPTPESPPAPPQNIYKTDSSINKNQQAERIKKLHKMEQDIKAFRSRWNSKNKLGLVKLGSNRAILNDIAEIHEQHGEALLDRLEKFFDIMERRTDRASSYSLGYFRKLLKEGLLDDDYEAPNLKWSDVAKIPQGNLASSLPPPERPAPNPAPPPFTLKPSPAVAWLEKWNAMMPDSARLIVVTPAHTSMVEAALANPLFVEHEGTILSRAARLANHPKFGPNVSIKWCLRPETWANLLNGDYNGWLKDVPESIVEPPPESPKPEPPYLSRGKRWADLNIGRIFVVKDLLTWDLAREADRHGMLPAIEKQIPQMVLWLIQNKPFPNPSDAALLESCVRVPIAELQANIAAILSPSNESNDPRVCLPAHDSRSPWHPDFLVVSRDIWTGLYAEYPRQEWSK